MDDSSKILLRKVAVPSKDFGDMTPEGFTKEVIYPLPESASPLIRLKPDATDFYRVFYDSTLNKGIMDALKKGSIAERDRISLLDDQFALARAGIQDSVEVLNFCRALAGESRHPVWSVLSDGLRQIRYLLEEASYPDGDDLVFPEPSKALCGLKKLYLELALPVYEKIGFEPSSVDTCNELLLRPIIISVLGHVGHGVVLSKARESLERHYKAVTLAPNGQAPDQSQLIPADLRTAVYSMCMRNGGDKEFSMLLEVSAPS